MKVLVADDDPIACCVLEGALRSWGNEVTVCADGAVAWKALAGSSPPSFACLDWMMPGLSGIELCKRIRKTPGLEATYVLLMAARIAKKDVIAGLDAGADDYLPKPFDLQELQSRVRVGRRILGLQESLGERVRELEATISRIKRLTGLLPICCYCKKIRDGRSYWQQVESYISAHAEVKFSHGICPECSAEHVTPMIEEMRRRQPVGQD